MDQQPIMAQNIASYLIYGLGQYHLTNFICSKIHKNKAFKLIPFILILIVSFKIGNHVNSVLKEENIFEILKIKRNATLKEIKRGFRKFALIYHPDKIDKNLPQNVQISLEEKFQKVQRMQKALMNDYHRFFYDRCGVRLDEDLTEKESQLLKDSYEYSNENVRQGIPLFKRVYGTNHLFDFFQEKQLMPTGIITLFIAFTTTSKKEKYAVYNILIFGFLRYYLSYYFLASIDYQIHLDSKWPQYTISERYNLTFGYLIFFSSIMKNIAQIFSSKSKWEWIEENTDEIIMDLEKIEAGITLESNKVNFKDEIEKIQQKLKMVSQTMKEEIQEMQQKEQKKEKYQIYAYIMFSANFILMGSDNSESIEMIKKKMFEAHQILKESQQQN